MGVRPVTLVEAHPASTAIAKMNPITFGDGFMAGMLALLKQHCPQATPIDDHHQGNDELSSMIGSASSGHSFWCGQPSQTPPREEERRGAGGWARCARETFAARRCIN